jgi:signal transduction histidine kinase
MTESNDTQLVTLEQAELVARLKWFIRQRWFFGAFVLGLGVLMMVRPLDEIRGGFLAAIGTVILAYNALFWFLERRLTGTKPELTLHRAPLAAFAQIGMDLLALTIVLHGLGGIMNPLSAYYIFHIIMATLLLPIREVFGVAALAIALFAMLGAAELQGWLPHTYVAVLGRNYRDPGFVTATVLAFASALIIAVYLGTSVARRLRERERDVLRLERELAARAQELEQANAALLTADEAKTQHFRKVSHELKAPVAAQLTLLRVLLMELKDHPAETRHRIERAIARADDLLALLNDLLALSRVRDVTKPLHCEWFDPYEQIRSILDGEELKAKEKGLTWTLDVRRPLPKLFITPGVVQTLAENIVSNAVKYTSPGGRVTVTLGGDSDTFVLAVEDTGIGIAQDDLARIGNEFFRTHQARQSKAPGTGLGMTIVKSMTEAAKGRLDIRSELGRGTTVTITLPVLHPDRCPLDVPPAKRAAPTQMPETNGPTETKS